MKDAVVEFYDGLHDFCRVLFTSIFMSDAMFYVAIIMILQWHVRKAFSTADFIKPVRAWLGRPRRNTRRLGLNLLILQLYFDPDMPEFIQVRKFTCSIWAILFETIVVYESVRYAANHVLQQEKPRRNSLNSPMLQDADQVADAEAEEDQDPRFDDDPDAEPQSDQTDSMYMDLTVGLYSVIPVFLVQLSLTAFYINELNDPDSATKDASNVEVGYWAVGVLIQLFAGEQQLGTPYNRQFWRKVMVHDPAAQSARVAQQTVKVLDKFPLTYRSVWRIRSWMDFVINALSRDIIMFTFPIMLCVEGPLDFVKDCCAVFFITTLDDTGFEKAKTIPQMMVRLKFNIFYDHLKSTDGDIEIPLKFTRKEAESAEFDPNVWDQFEKQREYTSPHISDMKLLDYMSQNLEPDSNEEPRTSGVRPSIS